MVVAGAVQGFLFALFGAVTAVLQLVIGPTYDGLLVPELDPGALYPAVLPGSGFLGPAVGFSGYLVVNLVDAAIPLLVAALGVIYLARAVVPNLAARTQALLPKLLVAVVLSNFSLPVASAVLGLAGVGYPVVAGFDGGAWEHWSNLAGPGFLRYSWDNGALAFVLSLLLFGLVVLLTAAVAVRDALLAVLLVLLPVLTLLYPIPGLSDLTRRGWVLFGQLAFLPWVLVVPLELAVGAGSAPLLVGYLTVALAAPGLLSFAGNSLASSGFPSAGGAINLGLSRNLAFGSSAAGTLVRPGGGRPAATPAAAIGSAVRTATSVPLPLSLPFFAGELVGHAAGRLFRHIPGALGRTGGPTMPSFPPVHAPGRRGGSG